MKLPKTDTRYWTDRVFFPKYTRDGETHALKEYGARMRHLGRRETFPLHTANKAAAAATRQPSHAKPRRNTLRPRIDAMAHDARPAILQAPHHVTVCGFLWFLCFNA